MMEFLYIHWNPDPALFHLGGFTLRWYSVLWMIAILTGSQVVYHLYKQKGLPLDTFQTLFTYSFIGIFAGARLGHCLFYDPQYFLTSSAGNHIAGTFPATGRMGVYRICRTGQPRRYAGTDPGTGAFLPENARFHFLDILDMMGVAAPVAAGFIRLANLMNSEIIGMPSDVPWAFIFERVDMQPRHPAQLYEALAYFLFFPDNGGHLPEEERKRTERLLFRLVYHPDFHLPFLRRVPERKTGGL